MIPESSRARIKAKDSAQCPCGARRQTVKHTLLKYPKHEGIRGDLRQEGGIDLTKLLKTSSLVAKITNLMLTTGELQQFRHTQYTQSVKYGEAEEKDS